ncbi:MAG: phosphoribosylformylglycinamidine synthase I [uncultured bacterium]|nr:MAG: phosphoribosylformylglycinamidine synthase I [uncultured bacterium]
MTKPKALILTGYGINCEEETSYAFGLAGAEAVILHMNDLIAEKNRILDFQILALPGGFSYGDDTGSGNAIANRIKNNLVEFIQRFIEKDTLTIGICNGCQVLANMGVIPGFEFHESKREVIFTHNTSARYEDRWVTLKVEKTDCVFTKGLQKLYIPVAHGEGNFYAKTTLINKLKEKRQIVLRYAKEDGTPAKGEFPYNPNGSCEDVAAICNPTGRVLALMPHPERHLFFCQHPDYPLLKEQLLRQNRSLPEKGEGIKLFENAVGWFG